VAVPNGGWAALDNRIDSSFSATIVALLNAASRLFWSIPAAAVLALSFGTLNKTDFKALNEMYFGISIHISR
jgi:hypothetical protein